MGTWPRPPVVRTQALFSSNVRLTGEKKKRNNGIFTFFEHTGCTRCIGVLARWMRNKCNENILE